MSKHKHNYQKHYNSENRPQPEIQTIPTNEVVEEVEEVETVAEEIAPAEVEAVTTVYGTVSNCAKLNIRKNPSINADVVCVVDADSELVIDLENSVGEWLNVATNDGIEGFCMKKFVTLDK